MSFFAKKSLGQNFLKSQAALRSIILAGEISEDDIVLEIGPGKGILTEKILEKDRKVVVVEKDDRLIPLLQEKFSEEIIAKKLEIIHADILEFDPKNMAQYGTFYKLIANIPYYITGALIRKFLESDFQPQRMILLLQKEVAQRIVARDGKESLLSLSVKAYGTPKYIETVKAKYFSPAPNVDSAIISIGNISKKFFEENNILEEQFFQVLKAGFAHKRKVLISNLKSLSLLTQKEHPKTLEEIFDTLSISRKARAEDIELETWRKICFELLR